MEQEQTLPELKLMVIVISIVLLLGFARSINEMGSIPVSIDSLSSPDRYPNGSTHLRVDEVRSLLLSE